MKLLRLAAVALPLVGCSMTLPVQGLVEGSDETFSGSATGYWDGGGTLQLTSNRSVTCTGDFVYVGRTFLRVDRVRSLGDILERQPSLLSQDSKVVRHNGQSVRSGQARCSPLRKIQV